MSALIAAAHRPVTRLLDRLDRVQHRRDGQVYASCPTSAHERGDRSRGLAVRELEDGRVLVHCHAGCSVEDVLAAVGLRMADLYPDRPEPSRGAGRSQHRLSHRDALRLLRREAFIALICARNVSEGKPLSTDDLERVNTATWRIAQVCDLAGVPER